MHVIVAEPVPFAVIFPLEDTVATFLLLLLHAFTFAPVNFNVVVSFFFKETFVLFKKGFFTVTLQVAFFLPAFTVIVALPFFFAVTFPFEETVATFLLDELHFTFFAPLAFNVIVCPTYIVVFVLLILTFDAASTFIGSIVTMSIKTSIKHICLFIFFIIYPPLF